MTTPIEGIIEIILIEKRGDVTIERHFPICEGDRTYCRVSTEIVPGKEIPIMDEVSVFTMDRMTGISLELLADVKNRKKGPPVMWYTQLYGDDR